MDLGTPTIRRFGDLRVEIHDDAAAAGRAAAVTAAAALRDAIARAGRARAIFATGTSQLAFFEALREVGDVAWGKVEAFHMDEYLGLDEAHPASFRGFLRRELVAPLGIGRFHGIDGDSGRADATIAAYAARLREAPIDLCCMGIGENGHLAFNDPPFARFDDPEPAPVRRSGARPGRASGRNQPPAAGGRGPFRRARGRPDARHHPHDPDAAGRRPGERRGA